MRRSRNKPQRKETMQKRLEKSRYANQNLISIFIVAMCCFGLVVANILYTMISKSISGHSMKSLPVILLLRFRLQRSTAKEEPSMTAIIRY